MNEWLTVVLDSCFHRPRRSAIENAVVVIVDILNFQCRMLIFPFKCTFVYDPQRREWCFWSTGWTTTLAAFSARSWMFKFKCYVCTISTELGSDLLNTLCKGSLLIFEIKEIIKPVACWGLSKLDWRVGDPSSLLARLESVEPELDSGELMIDATTEANRPVGGAIRGDDSRLRSANSISSSGPSSSPIKLRLCFW